MTGTVISLSVITTLNRSKGKEGVLFVGAVWCLFVFGLVQCVRLFNAPYI